MVIIPHNLSPVIWVKNVEYGHKFESIEMTLRKPTTGADLTKEFANVTLPDQDLLA
jgi:hypothetical protein